MQEVGQRHPPDERRRRRSRRCSPTATTVRQRGASPFAAPLERDDANDQEHEHEQQGEVEARERGGVPGREGGEGRAARYHQPDLVAVPHRTDRIEHRPPVVLVARQEREQGADAEVEALEQEVAGPEDGDEQEPELRRLMADALVAHRRKAGLLAVVPSSGGSRRA